MSLVARWGGWLCAASSLAVAQEPGPSEPWQLPIGYYDARPEGDYLEILYTGGIRMTRGTLEIRGQSGVILLDRDEAAALPEALGRETGLPRRSAPTPPARRRITEALLRERMSSFLRAAGRVDAQAPQTPGAFSFDLFRYLYMEGGVTVVRDGLEVIRAERLFFSPPEDRMTLEGAELRLFSTSSTGEEVMVTVRGDSILRSGSRWTGRNLSVTTCTAGEPHVEVISGEVEIIERGHQFEVRSRANQLAFSGVKVLPLPDVSYFTSEQTNLPIKGVSAGHSSRQGYEAALDLGGSMNDAGGAIHHFLTGRPAEEFRGDWNLGLAWVEERGFPTDLGFAYQGGDLYSGFLEGFYLDDQGENIREITNRLDGSLIDNTERYLIRTENRVILGPDTDLDLTLWSASDPAVYSEFFGGDYRRDKLPETSAYLKSGADNLLFTVEGRWDLNDFSYLSNRAQAPFFVEQLPLATFNWFSEPILDMPWGAPLQLSTATNVGQLNRSYDSTVVAPAEDPTFRFDQEAELASPFYLGPLGFRPFASARYTYYDNTAAGDSDDRWAFSAGVSAGTRLSRTWSSVDSDGNPTALRHTIAPRVSFVHQYDVGGDPADFIPYDEVDTLDEGALIQLELINTLQRSRSTPEGHVDEEFLNLDLIQNIHPIADRDNNGSRLGLLEYDLFLRPDQLIPVPGLELRFQGDYDFDPDEMRTMNAAVRLRDVLGLTLFGEYRTDAVTDGTVGYGITTTIFDRWQINGGSQFDLELNRSKSYAASLVRHDHDFSIFLLVDYDNISGETNISLNFEPTVGGLFQTERRRSLYAGRLYGGTSETIF